MKIYEKPSVEIKRFDVEDVMFTSGMFDDTNNEAFVQITGDGATPFTGVAFQW